MFHVIAKYWFFKKKGKYFDDKKDGPMVGSVFDKLSNQISSDYLPELVPRLVFDHVIACCIN